MELARYHTRWNESFTLINDLLKFEPDQIKMTLDDELLERKDLLRDILKIQNEQVTCPLMKPRLKRLQMEMITNDRLVTESTRLIMKLGTEKPGKTVSSPKF